jgi:hypothetical protein
MEDRFPEISAICQAARAVIRHRLGWQTCSLALDRTTREPAWTGRDLEDSSLWSPPDLQRKRQAAMFLGAGDIAAHMHLARQLGRQERAGVSTLEDAVYLSIAAFPTDHVRLEQFLDNLLEDTRAELEAHWRHVETLAAALLKRRVLSAEEITQILENDEVEHRPHTGK